MNVYKSQREKFFAFIREAIERKRQKEMSNNGTQTDKK